MSELTSKAQTRISGKETDLQVTHAEAELDGVLSVLADERHRQILAVVYESSDGMDVSTLADRVADRLAAEQSGPVSDGTGDRLHVSLHHRHLPKIAAAGLIKYDTQNRTVEATDAIKY